MFYKCDASSLNAKMNLFAESCTSAEAFPTIVLWGRLTAEGPRRARSTMNAANSERSFGRNPSAVCMTTVSPEILFSSKTIIPNIKWSLHRIGFSTVMPRPKSNWENLWQDQMKHETWHLSIYLSIYLSMMCSNRRLRKVRNQDVKRNWYFRPDSALDNILITPCKRTCTHTHTHTHTHTVFTPCPPHTARFPLLNCGVLDKEDTASWVIRPQTLTSSNNNTHKQLCLSVPLFHCRPWPPLLSTHGLMSASQWPSTSFASPSTPPPHPLASSSSPSPLKKN